jgi:hypothetical protein
MLRNNIQLVGHSSRVCWFSQNKWDRPFAKWLKLWVKSAIMKVRGPKMQFSFFFYQFSDFFLTKFTNLVIYMHFSGKLDERLKLVFLH